MDTNEDKRRKAVLANMEAANKNRIANRKAFKVKVGDPAVEISYKGTTIRVYPGEKNIRVMLTEPCGACACVYHEVSNVFEIGAKED